MFHPHGPVLALLLVSTEPIGAQTFSGSGGPIPDDGTWYEFQIPVSGLVPGTIDTTVFGVESVCIDLEHTWIADLDITIVAPDGTAALLVGGNGGDNDFYTNTCFNAAADTLINNGTPPYSGAYRPMTQMGVVNNGQDANGTWKLRFLDTYPFADTGQLYSWSIIFGPSPAGYTSLASSNLPIVVISTDGTAIPNEPKVPAEMGIINNAPGIPNHPTDPFTDYAGRIGIELRGHSSVGFPKKSYGIELWDAADNDTSVALLGMPEESDWVLKSSYSDKSLLNEPLTMHVFQVLGHYAPRYRHVELLLDGQYLGVYQWLEKIKRDDGRVDIAKLLPADISGDELTGGYIIKIDWWDGGDEGWASPHPPYNAPGSEQIEFLYEYPSDPVPQQEIYIQGTIASFENALAGPDFIDPVFGYRPFIDLRSWMDFLLLNELSRNVDGYRLSTFLHKDKNSNGGALRMGPPWDFDLAWHNADYCLGDSYSGWMYLFNYDCPGGRMVPFWWERMMEDSVFTDSLRCRWDALRDGPLSTDSLHAWCDAMADTLEVAQQRNFEVWPILGTYVWPNPGPIPTTYQGEISELKNWITLRALWMDANLPDLINGCSHVGLQEVGLEEPQVFPNPFRDHLSVILQGPGSWRLELIDPLGRIVHRDALAATSNDARRFEVRVPNLLPAGNYVVHLTDGDRSFALPVNEGVNGHRSAVYGMPLAKSGRPSLSSIPPPPRMFSKSRTLAPFHLFTLALFHSFTLSAKEQPITSKITEAKVFLSGAQVTRTASATITSGSTTLIFTGLSQEVDPQSIQVNGKGGFSILSVNHRMNYLTESPKKKEIEDLQERIKKYEHDWNIEKGLQQVWEHEESLLKQNWAVGGQQNGITAAQLQGVVDYQRERMKAMKAGWWAQQEKLEEIEVEAAKLRQQLAQLQAQAPRPTSEIVVEIDAPAEVPASFTLIYFVHSAGWTPAYDLRAKSVGQPIELLMKAQVINNSGEDWEKIDLALSSGNPTLGGDMPQLGPWVLEQPIYLQTISAGRKDKAVERPMAAPPSTADDGEGMVMYEDIPAYTEVSNTVVYRTTTVEFSIDVPFSVPSDGMAHTVGVKTHEVPAQFKHYCTPKLDKDAFLYARTTGWEDLNLLPGQANVFFEGTYVGQSFLDLSRPEDTLDISLGRDKGVVVERVKRKGFSDKPVIGGKRTVTIRWDLNVRNNKSTAVELEIRDQYPISSRSEVEVKLEDAGGAKVDETKGLLTWTLKLEPKAIQKLGFTYSVKHPKDQPVVLE